MRESTWYKVDLGLKMDNADIANADVVVVPGICPFAGEITKIMVGCKVYPDSGTVALANGSVNLLAATNVSVADLSAGVAVSETLAPGKMSRRVAAGNMLKATWTFETIGSGDGFSAEVWIEPDEF